MNERTSVVNISGDHEETLLQLAKHLGTSKLRRKIFNAIYGHGTKARSKKQIMEAARISTRGTRAQQGQNELDHLSKHHLIVKIENDGSVKDGSRYLYKKDETVRANRKQIVRWADNQAVASRVATKRRPAIRGIESLRRIAPSALKKRQRLTVLYLIANPDSASRLAVDVEVRRVQEEIRGSKFRDNIMIEYRPAADLKSPIRGLNDCRPQIVHFSGHGTARGIVTDDENRGRRATAVLSYRLLAKALSATDNPPRVIVLNSCESSRARTALLPPGDIVISMKEPVSDVAASVFAIHFYAAIAGGQSVKSAFEQGKVAVEAAAISEVDTPELFHVPSVDPGKLILT